MGTRFRFAIPACFVPLLLAASVRAQTGTIAGRVLDRDTRQPVVDARIEARNAAGSVRASVLSAEGGTFVIPRMAPGPYTLTVAFLGYEDTHVRVQVAADDTVRTDVLLGAKAFDLDRMVVSASKRPEKATEAPATVAVISERDIQARPATTPIDYVRTVPGVDVITYGIAGTNVVTRGFNNIFSGALHMLTDYRLAHVPSLRVNLAHFVPASDEDIERIEVVLGPGSALYGPNTANGVLHMITRSPLTTQGTVVSLAGGERDLLQGEFRTAHLLSPNLGVKLSGRYLDATEWKYTDPVEQAARAAAHADSAGFAAPLLLQGLSSAEINQRYSRLGDRNFDLRQWALEGRADWRITPDLTGIVSVGRSDMVSGIELTGLGAGQAKDWSYTYYQARINEGRFFAQTYLNTSDAGDTYTLKDGEAVVDRSKLWVAQVQHGFSFGTGQIFTYGLDVLRTLPESDNTIYTDSIDNDITEVGGYLQSETALSPKLDLVLAGRVDKHSELDHSVFSPRGGLVYKPAQGQSLRFTYNRAFSTPTAINLFLDKSGGLARGLESLGFLSRGQGTTKDGLQFQASDGTLTGMRSPFTPLGLGGPRTLLPATGPTLVQFWDAAVAALAQLAPQQLGQPLPPALVDYLRSQKPATDVIGLSIEDPITRSITPLAPGVVPDLPPLREEVTSNFELGYTGLLQQRVLLTADAWYAKHKDFVSPLIPVTPLVVMNTADLQQYLVPRLVPVLMASQGLTEIEAQAVAGAIAAGMGQIPLAVVSSDKVHADGADVVASYRNFGDIDLWGADLAATILLGRNWNLDLSASWVDKDHVTVPLAGAPQLVALNAPRDKASLGIGYRDADRGLEAQLRARYTDGFPANSADFLGLACLGMTGPGITDCVDAYTIVDLTAGYQLPRFRGASLQLSVSNLFDTPYRSFVGVPAIGRLAMLRLRYRF